jgi:hypothetical protein
VVPVTPKGRARICRLRNQSLSTWTK